MKLSRILHLLHRSRAALGMSGGDQLHIMYGTETPPTVVIRLSEPPEVMPMRAPGPPLRIVMGGTIEGRRSSAA